MTRAWAMAMAWAVAGCAPGTPWLSPTPEAAPHLDAAVAAWVAAGVDPGAVYIGPGGAPVTVTDGEPEPGARGVTTVAWDGTITRVRIQRGAPARTWTHEVGHVLGAGHGGCVMVSGGECADVTADDLALAGW